MADIELVAVEMNRSDQSHFVSAYVENDQFSDLVGV